MTMSVLGLSFSPKYCRAATSSPGPFVILGRGRKGRPNTTKGPGDEVGRAAAENAIKPLVFMYHEAMSIFLGRKNVLNLVYYWGFQEYTVSDPPPSHTI